MWGVCWHSSFDAGLDFLCLFVPFNYLTDTLQQSKRHTKVNQQPTWRSIQSFLFLLATFWSVNIIDLYLYGQFETKYKIFRDCVIYVFLCDLSFRNLVALTSLTERFLVRISGSRWKTDKQDVNWTAMLSIMLASFFNVGENSTWLLQKNRFKGYLR